MIVERYGSNHYAQQLKLHQGQKGSLMIKWPKNTSQPYTSDIKRELIVRVRRCSPDTEHHSAKLYTIYFYFWKEQIENVCI